jgi:zinc-binding in reverse transcriptase
MVVGQPWFPRWEDMVGLQTSNHIIVAELVDLVSRQWDIARLKDIFGAEKTNHIINQVMSPRKEVRLPYKLIWQVMKADHYTNKVGYRILARARGSLDATEIPQGLEQCESFWQIIWRKCKIIPKVVMFIWTACHDGLATAHALHRRIPAISPRYQRCGEENEFLTHLLFFRPTSQTVWFASNLHLRVNDLLIRFKEVLAQLMGRYEGPDLFLLCNMMWTIWKARNEVLFEGKLFHPVAMVIRGMVVLIPHNEAAVIKLGGLYRCRSMPM